MTNESKTSKLSEIIKRGDLSTEEFSLVVMAAKGIPENKLVNKIYSISDGFPIHSKIFSADEQETLATSIVSKIEMEKTQQ